VNRRQEAPQKEKTAKLKLKIIGKGLRETENVRDRPMWDGLSAAIPNLLAATTLVN
jgi:hypothetical protein